jgi:hypothetical protein
MGLESTVRERGKKKWKMDLFHFLVREKVL